MRRNIGVGVAVADNPAGPFKDDLKKAGPNFDYIDLTVFIDNDSKTYLFLGNQTLY